MVAYVNALLWSQKKMRSRGRNVIAIVVGHPVTYMHILYMCLNVSSCFTHVQCIHNVSMTAQPMFDLYMEINWSTITSGYFNLNRWAIMARTVEMLNNSLLFTISHINNTNRCQHTVINNPVSSNNSNIFFWWSGQAFLQHHRHSSSPSSAHSSDCSVASFVGT